MDKLRNDGYILIENIKYNKEFNKSLNIFYKNNKIQYKKLKYFIDKQYYPVLNKIINNDNKIYYEKFRFSNNIFNTSTFKGDIYNHTNENIINIYTCLYYFDDSYLEIIPESHRKDYFMINNSHSSFKNIKKLFIKKDTFVIFHSNIHYKKIEQSKNNRLLQIFNVCLNKKDYLNYSSKIIIVKMYDSIILKNFIDIYMKIFKNKNQSFITYIHYFLLYYDIQYKISLFSIDLSPYEKYDKLISYESFKGKYIEEIQTNEININVICDNNIKNCGPGYFYLYCTIIYWIISYLIFYYFFYKIKK